MRVDKFLKVSRLIKRRTVAKEVCDAGRVMVNGKPAKAGTTLVVGDEIEIRFGARMIRVRVNQLTETIKAKEASELYTQLD